MSAYNPATSRRGHTRFPSRTWKGDRAIALRLARRVRAIHQGLERMSRLGWGPRGDVTDREQRAEGFLRQARNDLIGALERLELIALKLGPPEVFDEAAPRSAFGATELKRKRARSVAKARRANSPARRRRRKWRG